MGAFENYFLLFCIYFLNISHSQTPQVITISPGFNEIANNYHPEISATFNVSMDSSSFDQVSFSVFAERSGYHSGIINYVDETKTTSFNSNKQFNAGERVTVTLSNKIKSQQGDSLNGFSWVFRIPSGIAPVYFSEAVSYGGGGNYTQCVDINNDNYPDIVTSAGVIWINYRNGVFNEYWLISDAIPDLPIIVDDFDRDGNMDVYYSAIDYPKLGLGDSNGNFNYTTLPYWFWNYVSDDFNNDGWPDLAGYSGVTYIPPDSTTLNWGIAFNDGNGNFNDTVMYKVGGGGRPEYIIATDLDNDGDNDIVIASHYEVNPNGIFGLNGILVGKNDSNGSFNSFDLYPDLQLYYPYYLYSSDFDNDSFNDVACISSGGGIIALNSDTGTFTYDSVRYYWPAELATAISGGDINGDGWIDIVVSGYEWPPELQIPYYAVTINDNSYFPGYWPWDDFSDTLPSGYILSTEAVDLNMDNRLDIVHNDIWYGLYITFNEDTISSNDENYNEPKDFYLSQNFPNPFNSTTNIRYTIPQYDRVTLKVFDLIGRELAILVNEEKQAGSYHFKFNANELSSGIYFYQLRAGELVDTKKLLLLK